MESFAEMAFIQNPWLLSFLGVSFLSLSFSFLLKGKAFILILFGGVLGVAGLVLEMLWGATFLEGAFWACLLLLGALIGFLIRKRRQDVLQ